MATRAGEDKPPVDRAWQTGGKIADKSDVGFFRGIELAVAFQIHIDAVQF